MNTIKIFLFTCLLFSSLITKSQDKSNLPSFIPTGDYRENYVNMSTGSVNLNIPLWQLKSGSLTVPISLNYSSQGINVYKQNGKFGINWNLDIGASLYQTVRSKNDLSSYIETDKIENPEDYLYNILEGEHNVEYDIFTAKIRNRIIQFTISGWDNFVTQHNPIEYFLLTDEKIKIEFLPHSGGQFIHGFKITDIDGTKYLFERGSRLNFDLSYKKIRQEAYNYYWHQHYLVGSWAVAYPSYDPQVIEDMGGWYEYIPKYSDGQTFLLSKIISANNTDSITFEYLPSPRNTESIYALRSQGQYLQEEDADPRGMNPDRNYFRKNVVDVHLSKIITANEEIDFNISKFTDSDYNSPYDNDYEPEYEYYTDKVVNSIDIKDENGISIKKYILNYSVGGETGTRIFLANLQETDKINKTLPPYKFFYSNKEEAADYKREEIDFWGYSHTLVQGNRLYFYRERFPEINIGKGGLLNRIIYPTGKEVFYQYENNTYNFDETGEWYDDHWNDILNENNYDIKNNLTGPGYRIKSIVTTDSINTEKIDYEYLNDIDNNISSGRLVQYPFFPYKETNNVEGGITITNTSMNMTGIENSAIFYNKITKYIGGKTYGNKGKNGKIEYFFSSEAPHENEENNTAYPLNIFNIATNCLPIHSVVYDKDNVKIKENISAYDFSLIENSLSSLKVYINPESSTWIPDWSRYHLEKVNNKLINNIDKEYDSQGETYVENLAVISYIKNGSTYPNPVNITQTESNGDTIVTYLYYPQDFKDINEINNLMVKRNMLSKIIKKEIYKNGEQISGKQTDYRFHFTEFGDTLIVPATQKIWENNAYKTVQWFNSYTDKGNLLTSTGIDNIPQSLIYDTDETQIIALVVNANADEIFHTSFEINDGFSTSLSKTGNDSHNGEFEFELPQQIGEYKLTYWRFSNDEWEFVNKIINNSGNGSTYIINDGTIDDVKVYPTDAYMSTATYKPLVGKTSETDVNDITTYYEYDGFGRLIKIFDQDKNLIKETEYYIKDNQ